MGLFSKVKDILFEEEEVTEAIPKVKEEPVAKRIERPLPKEEPVSEPVVENKKVIKEVQEEQPIEIDTYKNDDLFNDKSFPFQDFDEEEFSNSFQRNAVTEPSMRPQNTSRISKPKNTNVLDYERNKKAERRAELGRIEAKETPVERKKFKPSPIISPVYGILNEDYRIEDIKNRDEEETLTIEEVRKKAFEPERIVKPKKEELIEDTVTVKIKEPEEEKIQKVKTIDDLLEDTSDEVIDIEPTRNKDYDIQYDEVEKLNNEENDSRFKEDDTLENDLFDLIDSMYDQREDGDF